MSRNEYDWLGDGIYFFQDAPQRAREWAEATYGGDAAVLCSVIRLEATLDLLDTRWRSVLAEVYDMFLAKTKTVGLPLPVQRGGAHRLDREVINVTVGLLAEQGVTVRAVRAAFAEGTPVFPGSALFTHSHVQIAVRDASVIERTWLVEPTTESRS